MQSGLRPFFALFSLSSLALGAVGCHESSVEADFTGINVVSRFDGALPIDNLLITGKLDDGSDAFTAGTLKIATLTTPVARRKESLVVFLPETASGLRVVVTVDGRTDADRVLVSGTDTVRLELGEVVTASISLGAPDGCGDGFVAAAEACDDGNETSADGCTDKCQVERGFVCALAPSRCFDQATAVFADAGATCGGDGSITRPFCTLSEAVNAPRAAAVIVKRGLYRESVVLDRLRVELAAEDGAVLESMTAPALTISGGSIVRMRGLVVRGKDGAGGGLVAEGASTNVDLEDVELGPGAAIGVEVRDRALSKITRSIIRGNAGGGMKLDSASNYVVESSVIAENGTSTTSFGGVWIAQSSSGSRFVNNTVVENIASTSSAAAAGISCAVEAGIDNSIVWANEGAAPVQDGNCHPSYSALGPFAVDPGNLGTNFSMDPLYGSDFHLEAGSPCIDRGDPTGVVPAGIAPPTDIDLETRPQGLRVDVGADEAE